MSFWVFELVVFGLSATAPPPPTNLPPAAHSLPAPAARLPTHAHARLHSKPAKRPTAWRTSSIVRMSSRLQSDDSRMPQLRRHAATLPGVSASLSLGQYCLTSSLHALAVVLLRCGGGEKRDREGRGAQSE